MPKAKKLSWKSHKKKWSDCTLCDLCESRKKVVLLRGKIPCDFLFISEAPGQSDEVLGKPLSGPAGLLLNKMIEEAFGDRFRLAFTNLIGCLPRDENGNKLKEPTNDSIKACSGRILELVKLTLPSVIVCVGKVPHKHLMKILPTDILEVTTLLPILHPAGILRADVSQQGLAIQRNVLAIRDVGENIVPF